MMTPALQQKIARCAHALAHDPNLAQELTQLGLVAADIEYTKRESEPDNLEAWARHVARTAMLKALTKRSRRERHESPVPDTEWLATVPSAFMEIALADFLEELRRRLRPAAQRLLDAYRSAPRQAVELAQEQAAEAEARARVGARGWGWHRVRLTMRHYAAALHVGLATVSRLRAEIEQAARNLVAEENEACQPSPKN